MATHFQKTIKRVLCIVFAAICAVAAMCTFTSCKSAWPKVTMRIAFNDKTYTLTYKLYRKFFPQTVQHFIELADGGYYDGTCIHDYRDAYGMYVGGYTYSEESASDSATRGLVAKDYYEFVKDIKLTQTVFEYTTIDGNFSEKNLKGVDTLAGEFADNGYTIKNNSKNYGSKKEGALVMYYNDKTEYKGTSYVTVKRSGSKSSTAEGLPSEARWYDESRDYIYNSATSLFYISFTSSSSVEKSQTVFAELYNDDAETEYKSLTSAISKYITDNCEGEADDFTQETSSMRVDNEEGAYRRDWVVKAQYDVPVTPIIIRSVKVNRY